MCASGEGWPGLWIRCYESKAGSVGGLAAPPRRITQGLRNTFTTRPSRLLLDMPISVFVNEPFLFCATTPIGQVGFNSVDNGYMSFDHVRIPREDMLMRFSQVGSG